MKSDFFISLTGAALFLIFVFMIFNFQTNAFTGFAVEYTNQTHNFTDFQEEASNINYTNEDVLFAFEKSKLIIEEMKNMNFSYEYMQDNLDEAYRVYEQLNYALILGNTNSTPTQKENAKKALMLIDWKNLDYNDIIVYTNKISERRDKAYVLYDDLNVLSKNIQNYATSGGDVSIVTNLYNQAKIAFYEDRYEEASTLIENAKNELESKMVDASKLGGLRKNATNFIAKNWFYIIFVLAILLGLFFIIYRKMKKVILKNKIIKMKAEKQALYEMIKKTQEERFTLNKISSLVYNIRIKNYKEKIANIERNLPVLEANLVVKGKKVKVKRKKK